MFASETALINTSTTGNCVNSSNGYVMQNTPKTLSLMLHKLLASINRRKRVTSNEQCSII